MDKFGFVSLAAPMWLTMGCRDHHLKQTEYYGTGLNGWSVASIRGYHSLIMVGS